MLDLPIVNRIAAATICEPLTHSLGEGSYHRSEAASDQKE